MFKQSNFEDEIYKSMEKQLVSKQVEDNYGFKRLAQATDYLNAAAEIFEQAGMTDRANEITEVLLDLSKKLSNKTANKNEMPPEVKRVVDFAQQSANMSLDPFLAKKAVYASNYANNEFASGQKWTVCDNYEKYSDILLEFENGQWSFRNMYGEAKPKLISQKEAEANAKLMFGDFADNKFENMTEISNELKEYMP